MSRFSTWLEVHRRVLTILLCSASLTSYTSLAEALTIRPDFGLMTAAGPASVSVPEAPPGITASEFERIVRAGMERAAPGRVMDAAATRSGPSIRIVWHVDPEPPRGISRVAVNIFDGAQSRGYEQDVVVNDAPPISIEATVEAMSERLLVSLETGAAVSSHAPRHSVRS